VISNPARSPRAHAESVERTPGKTFTWPHFFHFLENPDNSAEWCKSVCLLSDNSKFDVCHVCHISDSKGDRVDRHSIGRLHLFWSLDEVDLRNCTSARLINIWILDRPIVTESWAGWTQTLTNARLSVVCLYSQILVVYRVCLYGFSDRLSVFDDRLSLLTIEPMCYLTSFNVLRSNVFERFTPIIEKSTDHRNLNGLCPWMPTEPPSWRFSWFVPFANLRDAMWLHWDRIT
jgi:hypothetical protein